MKGSEEPQTLEDRLDELADLIEENLKLAHDTNRILRDVRRTGRIAFWFKVILWTLVLVTPFFFIGPIMNFFTSLTGIAIPTNTGLLGIPSQTQIQDAISQYQKQIKTK